MRQLTVSGLDRRLQEHLRELARRERISLNKAALRLLERGAAAGPLQVDDRIGHSLDHFIGTWSAAEAKAFLGSIRECEQIDPEP